MKKDQLSKNIGHLVRLQPAASGLGGVADGDWRIVEVNDDYVCLQDHSSRTAIIGLDLIYSYFSDAARTTPEQTYGFLQLLAQVTIGRDGSIGVTPIPPPRASGVVPPLSPIEAEAFALAEREYNSLSQWHAARAVVEFLLTVGEATGREATEQLRMKCGDVEPNTLTRLANCTTLVQRTLPETKESRLLGYEGPYRIRPALRSALERLVAEEKNRKPTG